MAEPRARATIVPSKQFFERMVELGLAPRNCRRFIIDSGTPGQAMKIYFECFGDEQQLDAIVEGLVESLGTQKTGGTPE